MSLNQICLLVGENGLDYEYLQDLPFQTWVGHRDKYLDEMLRLEGRGDFAVYSTCGGCGVANPAFRCENQSCYGSGMFCQRCIVARHQVLPSHWIREWNGDFFKRVGLSTLGLVVQLGHTPGAACPTMRRGRYKFTLIDVNGLHNVAVQFCECDSRITHRQQLMRVCWWPATARDPSTCATFNVIRLFQNMNCLGKISSYHFLRSLELLTNADRLSPTPNRRRAFIHIVRQHRMMEGMKRAGRGHTDSGVGGTAQGELALLCRGCPQPGKNLPDGYKNALLLAQDCNFRLINRNVSSEARDPIINDGLGYFCNRTAYKTWLRNHVEEEEISTCSGFQAMFLANAKRVKGLRTTGVGGVTCTRHNMWCSNGIGDLQNGERYCNMDFIFFSAILNIIILWIILSYDIACQYSKNFWEQMGGLPAHMQLDVKKVAVFFKVPNFHMLGHKWPCHSPFSFHWMWGAGMTDGEDVEQNWEFTNGAAGSMKMMGPGGRHAFLEGLFAFHNWMRTVSYRKIFGQRMARNLKEARKHKEAFEAFTSLVEGERPELVVKWRAWVHDWESEQHVEGHGSPFEMVSKRGHTMKDIQLRLGKEELTKTALGVEIERQHTSSTFVTMGLEIEQSQFRRILTIDLAAMKDPTTTQELDFVKRKTALTKRIKRFRRLQLTYMPELRKVWEEKGRRAEMVKLFVPSELGTVTRQAACEKGLDGIEEEMREAELQESLDDIRDALRIRTMANRFRRRNTTGQAALTRGQGLLRQISVRIHKAKLRYRYARNALLRLRGHGSWEATYRTLAEEDIRGGGVAVAGVVAAGEGSHTMSWIWRSTKLGGEEELVDALRVEWCKVYARMHRWHEDIVLVEEEMRRTIEFGVWKAADWEARASARSRNVTAPLAEGLRAYAMEHVDRERVTSTLLGKQWVGLREKGRLYLAGIREEAGPDGRVPEVLVVDIDVDPNDEEGDVDGEEVVDGDGEEDAEDEGDED
ncbi:hypothetical protein C8F04DRAFT_1214342 [Mycena alexandri]|uniref:CxC2-like cysteine cluster KDZ transposase-associated domain-containing protein n=1 Tax=Mycena alexandri TaxID=1745969 RepID=A0AAD6S1W9_9AGAR|nr:hypothetical protein C8F04DRAFT_1214342 [Mycena alexandri]